jgi:hypothetical protein
MQISVNDIVVLLEQKKRKAEMEFRLKLLSSASSDEDAINSVKKSIREADEAVGSQLGRLESAGISLVRPFGQKIDSYDEQLSGFSSEDVLGAIRSKKGDAYDVLASKGELIKKNHSNRSNIAKILLLSSKMESKDSLIEAIHNGEIEECIPVLGLSNDEANLLARLLRRVGIPATLCEDGIHKGEDGCDLQVDIAGSVVWLDSEKHDTLKENIEKIRKLNSRIQLKNAERQIKDFSEDEESEFASIQAEYLRLLKEQDELLKDFKEEENLVITS